MSLLKYKYYDTPEGQDIYKKVFVTSKYAAMAGVTAATYDVLMFSHTKGFLKTAGRYFFYLGPMVGMATAFTVTANVARNIRDKNDKINYFLGGLAAGAIFGPWCRSAVAGVPIAILFGAAAIVKKTAVDAGFDLNPDIPHATKTIKSVKHDWTLVQDIPNLKNWTTGEN